MNGRRSMYQAAGIEHDVSTPERKRAGSSRGAGLGAMVPAAKAVTGAEVKTGAKPEVSAPEKKTLADLDQALALLDHELGAMKMREPLQIRAMGGYALMAHGVRKGERALTMDIDTMTADYQKQVKEAIERVGDRLGLAKDWLNNDVVFDGDVEQAEAMVEARWQEMGEVREDWTGYANIDMLLATIPTLTRSKLVAANDAVFSGRRQDTHDLTDLIDHQGIDSLESLRRAYPGVQYDHPTAYAVVGEHLGVYEPGHAERVATQMVDEYDELLDDDGMLDGEVWHDEDVDDFEP